MTHLEFAALESEALEPTGWTAWIDKAEAIARKLGIGRDEPGNLDGDQTEDGFSLDYAYDAFRDGRSPACYVDSI